MEVVWAGIKDTDRQVLAKAAFGKWMETWCGEGMPHISEMTYELEKEMSPRTPGQAFEMIVGYIDYRKPEADDFEVLSIEKPFIVPLDPTDPTLFYVGKIDKIVRYRGKKILGIEHKTTTAYKKNGPFRNEFLESFSPNSQVDGYLFALHMMFPGEVGGVWVDACLVHKSEEGFKYIPVEKQLRHLDSWIFDTRHWINQIEHEKEVLKEFCKPEDPYMGAFPKNTNSCWDFNHSCPYLHMCRSFPNPLGRNMPDSYTQEHWDPLDHVKGLDQLIEEKVA